MHCLNDCVSELGSPAASMGETVAAAKRPDVAWEDFEGFALARKSGCAAGAPRKSRFQVCSAHHIDLKTDSKPKAEGASMPS
jgi:hypothetical protein